MITFDTYALDKVIDERIESAFELGSVYGADLYDLAMTARVLSKILSRSCRS